MRTSTRGPTASPMPMTSSDHHPAALRDRLASQRRWIHRRRRPGHRRRRQRLERANMSGGWQKSFTLTSAAPATLTFRYNLRRGRVSQWRFGEALASLDGVLKGSLPAAYSRRSPDGCHEHDRMARCRSTWARCRPATTRWRWALTSHERPWRRRDGGNQDR